MNLRYLIREQVEQKNIFNEAQIRFNKLIENDLKFSPKTEYQYTTSINSKLLGAFGIFLKKVEIVMSIFNTGGGNYSVTFQIFFEYKNGQKAFVCNLNTLKVSNNKFKWTKPEK